jgi:hypothetical protein
MYGLFSMCLFLTYLAAQIYTSCDTFRVINLAAAGSVINQFLMGTTNLPVYLRTEQDVVSFI